VATCGDFVVPLVVPLALVLAAVSVFARVSESIRVYVSESSDFSWCIVLAGTSELGSLGAPLSTLSRPRATDRVLAVKSQTMNPSSR
jgi:hypothetical protein